MVKNVKFYELESKLAPIGYDCYNRDGNSITFVLNKYCVYVVGTVVDSGDSLSLTVELNMDIKAKTYSETTVSNIIYIMTHVLENVKELDAQAHKKVDSFDTFLPPVGVEISKAVTDIGNRLKSCGFTNLYDLYFTRRFDGGLGVIVSEEKRLVEIFISIGRSDFPIYRSDINVLYIKEMWTEIENIIDRFKQAFPANDSVAAETVFKDI